MKIFENYFKDLHIQQEQMGLELRERHGDMVRKFESITNGCIVAFGLFIVNKNKNIESCQPYSFNTVWKQIE